MSEEENKIVSELGNTEELQAKLAELKEKAAQLEPVQETKKKQHAFFELKSLLIGFIIGCLLTTGVLYFAIIRPVASGELELFKPTPQEVRLSGTITVGKDIVAGDYTVAEVNGHYFEFNLKRANSSSDTQKFSEDSWSEIILNDGDVIETKEAKTILIFTPVK
ncbi:MAG: hypothetical protein LBS41_00545 [Streptococcaceae bacterium]|jgi:hypothetical protein|nr:hypothetical protein [Streptococcaceae bacterium]